MIGNHTRIALQFSGGKDSLAVAHLLRPYWDRIAFYHVDTGDLLPEVREIVSATEGMVPVFHRIETMARSFLEGALPSDLVPTTGSHVGVLIGLGERRIVDRFDCCAFNIMRPMHERMIADGITLVIRGTKRADFAKMPAESGPTDMGYDLWLPLQEWSHEQVFDYLREVGAPICRVYEHKVNAPECATCPAWWSEGRASYLKKYHPELYASYRGRLETVAAEVAPLWAQLQQELAQ